MTYTRPELLAEIRDAADELGKPPTTQEMNERDGPSATTCANYFGSWRDALEEAGFKSRTQGAQYSEEELENALVSLTEKLGRTPSKTDMWTEMEISPGPFERVFGSWSDALRSVGITPPQRKTHDGHQLRFATHGRGWEEIRHVKPPDWNSGDFVKHHRLLAVAEYGFDEVEGKVVHHVNNIPWDNRPENLELLSSEEHGSIHGHD